MANDPFGNELPDQLPPGVRVLRLVGAAEVGVGLVVLIAGLAIGEAIVALIGAVLMVSSLTLFLFARSFARRG